jgi:hypothetical protein
MNVHSLYRPFLRLFRKRRMRLFGRRFGITQSTRVLDVGGSEFNWRFLPERPQLVILNLRASSGSKDWVVGDGCHLPFVDRAFDVVYSNSVIEHLGTSTNQRLFAAECARVGKRYYVQTPNRQFVVEPHLITPFIHWLPRTWQLRLLRNFTTWGLITRPTKQQCGCFLDEVRLLGYREMRALFPQAAIWRERFLGLTKSFIAVSNTDCD